MAAQGSKGGVFQEIKAEASGSFFDLATDVMENHFCCSLLAT